MRWIANGNQLGMVLMSRKLNIHEYDNRLFSVLQPAKDILEQVRRWSPVPVHTISFNCDDHDANSFLYGLSQQTGGRFISYFTDAQEEPTPERPYEVCLVNLLCTPPSACHLYIY